MMKCRALRRALIINIFPALREWSKGALMPVDSTCRVNKMLIFYHYICQLLFFVFQIWDLYYVILNDGNEDVIPRQKMH